MKSLFPLIVTDSLAECRDFYVSLFGFDVLVELDWYVQLQAPGREAIQLAFIVGGHDSVPAAFDKPPAGVVVSVETDDADAVHSRAQEAGLPMHVPLRDEPFGQRHFITEDPSGLLVDVFHLIAPAPDFQAELQG